MTVAVRGRRNPLSQSSSSSVERIRLRAVMKPGTALMLRS
ncbi:hypothetical protein BURPS406E_D0308 [Burkholderia pseudomallei 406e]|uniref:Uncharacterized protein n=2 Tax=Burkholderia pseudomallei TaxID=28450 RepID=A0A0E1W5K6_BURPE|nr:hypothetical protein BMASAVP1_1247 [Burkholderia mallei SAVP1]ABN85740.1 hypothetical protein BURPS668_A2838 [Burkholderia pseudomallei 668]ABN92705.1 hypothetical protein BURPS1106A_A2687 [Burkholderia pseudomallei 1106a]ABO03818.1 hypothetical protein BMA10247_A0103 [Burkholderia mallei NCTC 10247]AFR20576.1 hypothetical protein BPC006_II2651 [Burkholderia pseudomallei BPC006]EBA50407.1 hypothetical protein BURPS305_6245 [Burkholderia pseudomallei 305]EDK86650.1 hypothetical protein BMA7